MYQINKRSNIPASIKQMFHVQPNILVVKFCPSVDRMETISGNLFSNNPRIKSFSNPFVTLTLLVEDIRRVWSHSPANHIFFVRKFTCISALTKIRIWIQIKHSVLTKRWCQARCKRNKPWIIVWNAVNSCVRQCHIHIDNIIQG